MAFTIDTTSYPKAATYPVGHGYSTRSYPPSSIVVHSTNNSQANTAFDNEAEYLYTSNKVSADFLVGKDGQIVQFLDSRRYAAWHAGGLQSNGTWTAQPEYDNYHSIGIELHHSTPDPPYPKAQLDALAWLLQHLVTTYHIDPHKIDTHGQVAIAGPYLRKTDPDDWPHTDFIAWRDALFVVDPLRARTLPGAPPASAPIYCSVEAADFYTARGGLKVCGYPMQNEFYDASMAAHILVCERTVNKRSAAFGGEFALLIEAKREGWL